MNICVIHISDIHIKSNDTQLIGEAQKIAAKAFSQYRDSEYCLIAITGDVAYGGELSEYEIAEKFIKKLVYILENEKKIPIKIIVAPGNHDCKLIPENTIRSALIESIQLDNSKANDLKIIEECTSSQENFFKFRDLICGTDFILSDPLWRESEVLFGTKKIRFSVINASWMSTIREKQGSLVFPIKNYEKVLSDNCDFRFTFLHHPMNWYCQDTYHEFRRIIQARSSIVFSGHEHSALTSSVKTSDVITTVYFEGKALVPHGSEEESGFTVLLINLNSGDIGKKTFSRNESDFVEDPEHGLGLCLNAKNTVSSISESFLDVLRDPGANFSSPDKSALIMSDIFISPEIECQETRKILSFDQLKLIHSKTYITGDEQTGKTKILHESFSRLHAQGLNPVCVDANDIKRCTRDGIKRAIEKSVKQQYMESYDHSSLEKKERALLIDNYEIIGVLRKGLDSVFQYIDENFSTVIICCGNIFNSLISNTGTQTKHLEDYSHYHLKDFGSSLRYQLIKKWHSFQDGQTLQEFEERVHRTEKTITAVLGKNLVPSRPLYLLTLLQSTSAQGKEELHNSGMSYYYQYLITKSLDEAGVGRDEYDEMFNYLSNLAWFFRVSDSDSLEERDIESFNSQFSKKFTTVKLERQLSILQRAKVLISVGGQYKFAYPYIKYFFLGKYFADHIDDQEIILVINQCCESLNARESSNLVLFLTHHKNSDWVVDNISINLSKCFESFTPIEFGADTNYLSDLIGSISEVVISELNVDENQRKQREFEEEKEEEEEEYERSEQELRKSDEDYSPTLNDVFKLFRSSEVLGQILKNYYGSITRDKKRSYLVEAMNAPLRLLGFILSELLSDPEGLAHKIEKTLLDKDKTLTEKDVKEISAKFIADFTGNLCTGIVAKAAESVGSEKLKEDIDIVVANGSSISHKLIQAAMTLISPNRLPIDKLKRLARELESNPLAFTVLQNLVLYHIHMFHTPDREKQALGALVRVNLQGIKSPAKLKRKSSI